MTTRIYCKGDSFAYGSSDQQAIGEPFSPKTRQDFETAFERYRQGLHPVDRGSVYLSYEAQSFIERHWIDKCK